MRVVLLQLTWCIVTALYGCKMHLWLGQHVLILVSLVLSGLLVLRGLLLLRVRLLRRRRRRALLLGRAKDNNAYCALGPFLRFSVESFGIDDVRHLMGADQRFLEQF